MAKYFPIPFAMNGDRKEIPIDKQDDGSISFDEGYGADYEKNKQVDPTAKDISRQEFNSVLHDITGAIGEIQRSGVATWTNEISYSKGATIIHNGAVYTSTINANKNEPPHASWSLLDLSEYRKKDDLLFKGMMQVQATDDVGTGVFLLDEEGNPRGQMIYNSYGVQFAQVQEDGSHQTFTFPRFGEGGEVLLDSKVSNSWEQASGSDLLTAEAVKEHFEIKENTIIKVPSDIPSLRGAFDLIRETGVNFNNSYIIELDSDYLITESLEFTNVNLRNITITSSSVIKTSTNFKAPFIFKFTNSVSPIISLLIDADGRGGIGIDVVNSNILVNANCGVTNAELSGIRVTGSSTGVLDNSIFTNAVQRRKTDPSFTDHHGISVVGSTISAMGADVSGSLYYGIASSQGGAVNFRQGKANNCYRHAIRASQNAYVDAFSASVDNCGNYAVYAWINSTIRVGSIIIRNAGEGAIVSYSNSLVYAEGAEVVGGCSLFALRANSTSKIEFNSGKISNVQCTQGVLVADNVSDITALACTIDVIGLNSNVLFCASLSRLNLQNATIKSVTMLKPFSSIRGSSVYLIGAKLILDESSQVTVSYGGTCHVRDCTFNGDSISKVNINLNEFNTVYGNGLIYK